MCKACGQAVKKPWTDGAEDLHNLWMSATSLADLRLTHQLSTLFPAGHPLDIPHTPTSIPPLFIRLFSPVSTPLIIIKTT